MNPLFYRILAFGIPLLLMCCARVPNPPPGTDGRLPPCPSSPNCVSTEAADPDKRMAPLPYRGERAAAMAILLTVIDGMPRTTVVTRQEHYLRVEFRSRLFGFVDDVAFVFDDETGEIHFRSAARSGYWDMGVNRRRMHSIREAYQHAVIDELAEKTLAE